MKERFSIHGVLDAKANPKGMGNFYIIIFIRFLFLHLENQLQFPWEIFLSILKCLNSNNINEGTR